MRPCLAFAILLLSGLGCQAVLAQPATGGTALAHPDVSLPPSIAAAIKDAHAALPRKQGLTADQRKQAEDLLRDALADDQQANDEVVKLHAFEDAAEQARQNERTPSASKDTAPAFADWQAKLPQDASTDRLSDLLEQERGQLASAQDGLHSVEDALQKISDRPDALRDELAAARAESDTTTKAASTPSGLQEASTLRAQAALRLRRCRVAALEMEQRTLEPRLRALFAQRSELRRDVDQHGQRVHLLENIVLDRANSNVADIVVRLTHDRDALVADKASPSLEQVATATLDLGNDLVATLARTGSLRDQRNEYASERAAAEKSGKTAQARIELGGSSEEVGALLLAERRKLKPLVTLNHGLAALRDELAQTKLSLLDLREQQDGLEDMDAAIARTLQQSGQLPVLTGPLHDKLQSLLATRSDVLTRLISAKSRQAELLSDAERQLAGLTEHTKALLALLDAHLLGTPSHAPIGLAWIVNCARALRDLHNTGPPGSTFVVRRVGFFLPLFALLVVLAAIFLHRRVPLAFERLAAPMRRIRSDRFRFTLQAGALTLIAAAPFAVLWLILGRVFLQASGGELPIAALGNACSVLAAPWFALALLRWITRENGLAHLHFRWQRAKRIAARRAAFGLYFALLIPLFVHTFLRELNNEDADATIGRGLFIVGAIVVAAIAWRACAAWMQRGGTQEEPQRSQQFVRVGLSGVSLTLALLAAAGYYFTAVTLGGHFVASAIAILAVVILNGFAVRWLTLGERRLALKRAEDKRAADLKARGAEADGEALPEVDLDETAISQLGAQTRRVLRLAIWILLGTSLLIVWSDIAPALSFLDKYPVWNSTYADADGKQIGFKVTLRAVFESLLILTMTFIATRNLPGLLEIGVLRRINLDAPTRYAITSVVRYLIVLVGTLVGIALLGVHWSNLQWLAAGLTVGLGFGLQEIFANFISGLIVLFERPCRVGDIITIGNVEGTVTRIRTRATTIVDWDNKEVIVPNKSFITERLVNWTLSDSTTRVVIKVGIAYRNDPRTAQRLLLDTATGHDLVLGDPAPVAWMMTFGNSTLDFELRFFVAEINQRNLVRTELMMRIAEVFAANDIEIAFPQQDLWLRNAPALTDPAPAAISQPADNAEPMKSSKRA